MGQAYAPHFCPGCNKAVMAVRDTPSHLVHFVLSLTTAGIWLVVWIGLTLIRLGRFRCPKCRAATLPSVPDHKPITHRRPAFLFRAVKPWSPLVRW